MDEMELKLEIYCKQNGMGYPYEDRRLKAMAKLCCGCQGC
jgi:hypothetical protein